MKLEKKYTNKRELYHRDILKQIKENPRVEEYSEWTERWKRKHQQKAAEMHPLQ